MELEEPLFNPVKRRKYLRRRPTTPPTESRSAAQDQSVESSVVTPSAIANDDQAAPIAELLRARKTLRPRRAGIEFSTEPRWSSENTPRASSEASAANDIGNGRLGGISDRFVGLTGQRVDVDRHISPEESLSDQAASGKANNRSAELRLPQRQPATLGKLHEIDLGPDSKLRNIERTEAATRSLVSGERVQFDDGNVGGKKSKNGKPWRHRKRRNSEDIQRDQLVEEVLRESKLEVYEEPQQEQHDDDQAADDRIAEQFRRDFLDAIQSRRRGARSKNTKTSKSDAPRGPKLGGSRSARAAMREKKEKEAKK
ncbi:hypothetical protein PRK78_003416 [Emydomyces testavorans]|uniref:Uncharacterized protein n=1 Tax=Emydomyces testavorans TaxID=2070801 RepID=A0AAF0DGV1_9EURO|nr:hypothetical protein PRK78_003416 [Emydomyces testavorans]